MKNILFTLLVLFLNSCNSNDDNSLKPIDQLPKATQIGANTAGALVDGEILLPKGGGLIPNLVCFYQFVNGSYFFSVGFFDSKNEPQRSLNVFTAFIELESGKTYALINPDENTITGAGAEYNINAGLTDSFNTSADISGELMITHLDVANSTISGTFWFNAINNNGEIIEIREGRFDMPYSK